MSNITLHDVLGQDNLSDCAANMLYWMMGQSSSNVLAGQTVTAAAASGAGTSPPAPVVGAGSNSTRGSLTFGTGSGSPTGAMVTVTFANALAAAPYVIVIPANSATAALGPVYATSVTSAGFTIDATSPAASQANTTYAVTWFAMV